MLWAAYVHHRLLFDPRYASFCDINSTISCSDVLLSRYSSAYGVPISHEIEQQTGRDVALGSVYAALDRLERKGYVSSTLGDPTPERGGRAKRYFQITAKGVKEVRDAQRMLTNMWRNLSVLQGELA